MLTERWFQFEAGTEGVLLEVSGDQALVALYGAPVQLPVRILSDR